MRYLSVFCGFILSISFITCSNDKEIEGPENISEANAIVLSSPEGFEIAASEKELQTRVGKAVDIAPANLEIESVEFVDSEKVSIAYVNYRNVESEESSNVVIAKGGFKYDTGHLQLNNIGDNNKATEGQLLNFHSPSIRFSEKD